MTTKTLAFAVRHILEKFDHTLTDWHHDNDTQNKTARGRILDGLVFMMNNQVTNTERAIGDWCIRVQELKKGAYATTDTGDNAIQNFVRLIENGMRDVEVYEEELIELKKLYKDVIGFNWVKPMSKSEWDKLNASKQKTQSSADLDVLAENPRLAKYFKTE